MTSEHIAFAVDDARFESPFPQGAGAPMHGIDDANVLSTDMLHGRGYGAGLERRNEQVNVVGHQDISVHAATVARCTFGQALQIKATVDVAEEASRAVIASLQNVQRNASRFQAGWPWHGGFNAPRPKRLRSALVHFR
jgi:hypothetical protein